MRFHVEKPYLVEIFNYYVWQQFCVRNRALSPLPDGSGPPRDAPPKAIASAFIIP
jgi:hypothetical protein